MNPLRRLADFGQSVWLDYIERGFVRGGALARLIEHDGVSGLTSNPAIFQQALAGHGAYEAAIAAHARAGLAAHEIHEALLIEDIRNAADLLQPVYQHAQGRDGFVSLEVSPHFARDTDGTYWEAKRLWTLVNRVNLMIKVPGTSAGVPAVRRLIADGININVTLLFSAERYAAVADAFLAGLTDRHGRGLPIDRVAGVASFFLSRIDTLLDPRLDAAVEPQVRALRGHCAIACARAAYRHYRATIASPRWQELSAQGARSQRLLWASTGTKDPAYSDVKYVEALVGPDTVTTLPPATLAAFRDHGVAARRLPDDPQRATPPMSEVLSRLAAAGIEWPAIAAELEEDGLQKFIVPHEATLAALRSRIAALRGQ